MEGKMTVVQATCPHCRKVLPLYDGKLTVQVCPGCFRLVAVAAGGRSGLSWRQVVGQLPSLA